MQPYKVVSHEEWLAARKAHLAKEKELTRLRDKLNAERRELPWIKVEKTYVFDTRDGKKTLADLFDGRSQLIVQHFMFGPDWEEGCIGCSFTADHIESALLHIPHHDVSFVRISRAPLDKLEAYRERMGWKAPWASSYGTEFNFDFHVSFKPEQVANKRVYYNYELRYFKADELSGLSVFFKDASGDVFHTYSTYARGDELVDTSYMLLDMTPKGRNETGPHYDLMDWVKRHDEYEGASSSCCGSNARTNAA
jgi:predicted dithiol-disulfide oxidoreductase (DUF899 family)